MKVWHLLLATFLIMVGMFVYLLLIGVQVLYALCIFILPVVIWGQYFFLMWKHDKSNDGAILNDGCHNAYFELKQCPDCGGMAELCGEGMAKSVFEDGEERMFFTDFDGYTVSCEDCTKTTKLYRMPEAAVEAWNKSE